MAQNQHYISRCLTKPWESKGTLYYFDFEDQEIKPESSKKLFAQMDLWSPKLETTFHKRFEKHLTADILKFMKAAPVPTGAIPFRYILLMHLFNAMRSMKARYNNSTIEQFAKLSNGQLDKEIAEFLRTNLIVRIPINPAYRLFFSEDGFFQVPLAMTNSREMSVGFAVPLSTSLAFGIFPEGYDLDELMSRAQGSDSHFVDLSVGVSARRLVIHPDLVKQEPNLKEKILQARATNKKIAQQVIHSSRSLQDRIDKAIQNLKPSK